jgi:hypothetical protein
LYVIAFCSVFWPKILEIKALSLNEIGDFLAGLFAPLAFLWIIVTVYMQKVELSQNTAALEQQAEELRSAVAEAARQTEQLAGSKKTQQMEVSHQIFESYVAILSNYSLEIISLIPPSLNQNAQTEVWSRFAAGDRLAWVRLADARLRNALEKLSTEDKGLLDSQWRALDMLFKKYAETRSDMALSLNPDYSPGGMTWLAGMDQAIDMAYEFVAKPIPAPPARRSSPPCPMIPRCCPVCHPSRASISTPASMAGRSRRMAGCCSCARSSASSA